jgi:light-regulated signal transduction histidine kinase (bacteriophytochrome)
MSNLIKALLEYSRIRSRTQELEQVDTGALVAGILQNLRLWIEETGAQVSVDPLPQVTADTSQLGQVFQNLIENALKFRRENEPPKIHVAAEEKDGQWIFQVCDNGIGIEPIFYELIFQPFKRLHARRDRYPGTGIGLAIVKRIVERHHGRVWVESQSKKGTTFYFTLPQSPKSSN